MQVDIESIDISETQNFSQFITDTESLKRIKEDLSTDIQYILNSWYEDFIKADKYPLYSSQISALQIQKDGEEIPENDHIKLNLLIIPGHNASELIKFTRTYGISATQSQLSKLVLFRIKATYKLLKIEQ